MEENKIIGSNLKTLREANGYTQEKIADYLSINRSAYANYEAGTREIPIEILEKASNLFGCELNLLFSRNQQELSDVLVCTLRADTLSTSDMQEVSAFKNIVLNYQKINRLLNK